MIYLDISLPVPVDNRRYELQKIRDSLTYVKYRVKSYRLKGKLKHERILIGKLSDEQLDGVKLFHPNSKYFEFLKKPLPTCSTVKTVGRPRKIIDANNKDVSSKNDNLAFGYTIACHAIAKELNLYKMLESSFGEKITNKIMAVASFFAAGAPGGLTNIDHYTNKHMCFIDKTLSSQELSELYRDINSSDYNDFFRQWALYCCKDDYVCYDVTSISNYSTSMPMVAWGYNRDKEQLPQINVGLFCTIKHKLPVFFTPYNGSINDFTNLPYILEQAKSCGINFSKPITLVMDGGFAVKDSLENTRNYGCDLIVGAPLDFCTNIRQYILNWRRSPLSNKTVLIQRSGETVRSSVEELSIGRIKTKLFMYKSPLSTARDEQALTSYVNKISEELSNITHISDIKLKQYSEFYDIRVNDKEITCKLKTEQYNQLLELCGCFAILTTRDDLSPEEIFDIYRAKDCVEKAFAIYKNDILEERLEVKSQDSINGKMFLAFIALIIRKSLDNKLRSYLTKTRIGLDSAISRLSDITCIKKDHNWMLKSALTKQQKELISVLNLPINYLDI